MSQALLFPFCKKLKVLELHEYRPLMLGGGVALTQWESKSWGRCLRTHLGSALADPPGAAASGLTSTVLIPDAGPH